MNEEMKKIEIQSCMFHRLNLEQLETLQKMTDAVVAYDRKKDSVPEEGSKTSILYGH
jgi:hypothetical protein